MDPRARQFIDFGRSLVGARWRHRGRKASAVDCIGLVTLSMEAAGMKIDGPRRYGREPWDGQLQRGLERHFGKPVSQPRPGDIALIRWGREEPSHLAIIGDHPNGGLSLIHAHSLHGVIEQSIAGRVGECVVAYYRPWTGET